jgi:2-keto-4-pentenoate hydratase/2-oxohepta-3-ene-1,7-dioic acid hydratase in catechol pathway
MRLCRFRRKSSPEVGFYDEQHVVPVADAAQRYAQATDAQLKLPGGDQLTDFLACGIAYPETRALWHWVQESPHELGDVRVDIDRVQLLVPIARPNKLFLLAGNYAKHIEERGGVAAERAETFPYVFMKPPSTTLNDPGKPFVIPAISPDAMDWELELAVVIGARARGIAEEEALRYVAGYTVINDISNRKFRPHPQRRKRDRDAFFDWQHGKWFDGSCPCGPCVTSAESISDPQNLTMQLRVSGDLKQDATTSQQIFPVAAVIAFISSFVTLEPGDIISTGTPAGVGHASETFLKPGDLVEATIEAIGTLVTPIESA